MPQNPRVPAGARTCVPPEFGSTCGPSNPYKCRTGSQRRQSARAESERPVTEPHDTHPPSPDGEIVIYDQPPDDAPLEVRLERDTLWLT